MGWTLELPRGTLEKASYVRKIHFRDRPSAQHHHDWVATPPFRLGVLVDFEDSGSRSWSECGPHQGCTLRRQETRARGCRGSAFVLIPK
jgi:hypothetical protein